MSGVVVLGWDGLDIQHMERFGLCDRFGTHQTTIDTYVNPHIGAPHTKELWPSMITGLHPDDHGVHAARENGVNWDSRVLRQGSAIAENTIPDGVQNWLGRRLRDAGAALDSKTAAYYDEHGISTVFDGAGGRAISIPNFVTELDRQHGFASGREELWQQLNVVRVDGHKDPQVDRGRVYDLLGREVGRRQGATIGALAAGRGLVWTWFGLLDTVGHLQPALGEELVRDWYHVAASVTDTVRGGVDDETTVVCVSDHGIDMSEHTEYATIASDDPDPVERIDHVFDVAEWVRGVEPEGASGHEAVDAGAVEDVRDDLAALGYIDS